MEAIFAPRSNILEALIILLDYFYQEFLASKMHLKSKLVYCSSFSRFQWKQIYYCKPGKEILHFLLNLFLCFFETINFCISKRAWLFCSFYSASNFRLRKKCSESPNIRKKLCPTTLLSESPTVLKPPLQMKYVTLHPISPHQAMPQKINLIKVSNKMFFS